MQRGGVWRKWEGGYLEDSRSSLDLNLRENATILRLLQNAREREEGRKKTLLRAEKQKETLVRDISRLWINASESGDFLIVCRGQEFPCHRAILSARFACKSFDLF